MSRAGYRHFYPYAGTPRPITPPQPARVNPRSRPITVPPRSAPVGGAGGLPKVSHTLKTEPCRPRTSFTYAYSRRKPRRRMCGARPLPRFWHFRGTVTPGDCWGYRNLPRMPRMPRYDCSYIGGVIREKSSVYTKRGAVAAVAAVAECGFSFSHKGLRCHEGRKSVAAPWQITQIHTAKLPILTFAARVPPGTNPCYITRMRKEPTNASAAACLQPRRAAGCDRRNSGAGDVRGGSAAARAALHPRAIAGADGGCGGVAVANRDRRAALALAGRGSSRARIDVAAAAVDPSPNARGDRVGVRFEPRHEDKASA